MLEETKMKILEYFHEVIHEECCQFYDEVEEAKLIEDFDQYHEERIRAFWSLKQKEFPDYQNTSVCYGLLNDIDFWDFRENCLEEEEEGDEALEKEAMGFDDEYWVEEERIEQEAREMDDLEKQTKKLDFQHGKDRRKNVHQKKLEEAELEIPYCTNVERLCHFVYQKMYMEAKIRAPKSEVDHDLFREEFYRLADSLFQ